MSINVQILPSLFPHHKLKSLTHNNPLSISYKDHLNEWRFASTPDKFLVEMLDKNGRVNLFTYDSEYKACLDFLYLCQIITTNDPETPKILVASENYRFCEKNGSYSLEIRIMFGTHGERHVEIELNQDEIDVFEKNGMSFIYQLMNKMEKEEALYRKRSFPNWWTSSQEYHDWIDLNTPKKPKVIENIIYQEPPKNGGKFLLFFIFILIALYVLFFISL